LKEEIKERNEQLQTLVNGLTAENMKLKEALREVEARLKQREVTQGDIKYVLSVLMKAPFGADEGKKEFEKKYERAMKIVEGWKR